MSLLDDVSVVVTPNGYKAGTLYSVLPTAIAGSELVQDSNFTLTGTQAQNTAGTYWVTYAGWTISGGKALRSGVSSNTPIAQNVPVVNGKVYKFSYTRTYASGNGETNLFVQTDGSNYVTLGSYTSTVVEEHTVTGTFVAGFTGNIFWQLYGIGTFAGSVDNISVKEWSGADMEVTRATAATRVDENGLVNYAEVLGSEKVSCGSFDCADPNAEWITEAGWSFSGGNANRTNTGTFTALQQNILESGKTYKVTFTISSITSGEIYGIRLGSNYILRDKSTTGTYTGYGTANGTTLSIMGNQTFAGSVDNISVKEETRDNVPRIDYTGGGCPHILAEPQRTNTETKSNGFSTWAANSNITRTADYITSPDGTQNATRLQFTANGFTANTAQTASAQNTVSCYAKRNDSGTQSIGFFKNGSGTVDSAWSLTSDWKRFTYTYTAASGFGYVGIAGDSGADVSVFGFQTEAASYATSYIPTSGSTVTRNQDVFKRDGIASLINSPEGVLFVEMALLIDDDSNKYITLTDVLGANKVQIDFDYSSSRLQYVVVSGGVTQCNIKISYAGTNMDKLAFKWKENDFAVWINGVERGTDTSGSASIGLNTLKLSAPSGSNNFNGKVKQLQVYKTALTDTQLAALTT